MLVGFALLLLVAADRVDTVAGSDWVGDGGLATDAVFQQADGIAIDSQGNIFVSDAVDHRVRKITPAKIISTVAGTGSAGFSGDGGPAAAAQLNAPYGLAADGAGNLFIADLGNGRVRRVAPDGTISTVAMMIAPRNVALDGFGGLYISDFSGQRVYRLGADGTLVPFAGTGVAGTSPDGTQAALAQLAYPAGLAVDSQGAVYIGDTQNHAVRKIARGVMTTVARDSTPVGLAFDSIGILNIADPIAGQIVHLPGTVLASNAKDLAIGRDGYLYAAEGADVRRVSFTGASPIVAGGGSLLHGDGGPATAARLNHPSGVAVDGQGDVYIADRDNGRIRKVTPDGIITSAVQVDTPASVSVDLNGALYIAGSSVQKMPTAGTLSPLASQGSYAIPGPDGYIYIAQPTTIVKANAAGGLITVLDQLNGPRGLAFDFSGRLHFTLPDGPRRLEPNGNLTALGPGVAWVDPRGIAVGSNGDVLVADPGQQRVLRISGDSVTVAANLNAPWDIAAAPDGTFLVADPGSNRIYRLTPVTGISISNGTIAPGMLVTIQGSGLSGTQVLFDSTPVPILSLNDTGLVVRAPVQISGTVRVDIVSGAQTLAEIPVTVVAAAPAIFAVANQDGTPNSLTNPAGRGSVVTIYGTGEGVSGFPITARAGGLPADVLYAGSVAGYPGLLQVNVRIPAGYIAAGQMSIAIAAGDFASQPFAITVN